MNNKEVNTILLALLQDIKGNTSEKGASTAAIASVDAKSDGFTKKDAYTIAGNSVLDQSGDPIVKIQFTFGTHPELIEHLSNWAGGDITPVIQSNNLDAIQTMLSEYLEENNITIFGEGGQFETEMKTIPVKIGNKTYKLLVAETEEQKEKGLMEVEEMDSDEGMLFDYSDNPLEKASFWMKNTTIPLDIIFVDSEGIVISVKQGIPETEDLIEEDDVACVIELNQNSGVKPGDETDLFDEDDNSNLKVNKLYIYGSNGQVQAEIEAGCRIFSRPNTKTLIKLCKRAYLSKLDNDYKKIGRKVFEYMQQQDSREPEYVS